MNWLVYVFAKKIAVSNTVYMGFLMGYTVLYI